MSEWLTSVPELLRQYPRSELTEFFDKLPGVTLEEAERRVEERGGRVAR